MRKTTLLSVSPMLFALCIAATAQIAAVPEASLPEPKAVPGTANLLRLEGIDAESGTHYVRLLLSLPQSVDATSAAPRFTVECRERKGKREMMWFLSFGGVTDCAFEPPFRPAPGNPFPPTFPGVNLKMRFEGYINSKYFTESWSELPSGELRYRNPGKDGPNLDTSRLFLQYLHSLPGLRISYAKPTQGKPHEELFFATKPLLDEISKTPICEP